MRTNTRAFQPRHVRRPETLCIGDAISVTFPETDGRAVTWSGIIGHRTHEQHRTIYTTTEGATLFAIGPDLKQPKIILLKRAEDYTSMLLF